MSAYRPLHRHGLAWLIVLTVLGLFPAPAPAVVYKCVDAVGRVAYMDKPCPRDAVESQVMLPKGGGLSAEEREWLERARPAMESSCAQALTTANSEDPQEGMAPETIARICECAARRYFSGTPISRLRQLEAAGDGQSPQLLLKSAMAACAERVFGRE